MVHNFPEVMTHGKDIPGSKIYQNILPRQRNAIQRQCSRDISIKTRSALNAKRKQGKYVGAIPIYGYQKSLEDKHILIPDPNTATVVQSIFDMKLHGKGKIYCAHCGGFLERKKNHGEYIFQCVANRVAPDTCVGNRICESDVSIAVLEPLSST